MKRYLLQTAGFENKPTRFDIREIEVEEETTEKYKIKGDIGYYPIAKFSDRKVFDYYCLTKDSAETLRIALISQMKNDRIAKISALESQIQEFQYEINYIENLLL